MEVFFFRNLKRIFLLVGERETSISTSFVPNIYEIIHKLCLVSAFPCIGNSDCPGIGASDGLFHKLNQRVLQHCKCYMDGFFLDGVLHILFVVVIVVSCIKSILKISVM